MNRTRETDPRISRYLLGDLDEAEESAIERNYFADAEMFEDVWAAENDLVDRYVRSLLPPDDSVLFERNYLRSVPHLARVAVARRLLSSAAVSERVSTASESSPSGPNKSALAWFETLVSSARLRGAFAATTAVLFLAGFTWLVIDRIRLKEHLGGVETELANQRRDRREIEKLLAAESDKGSKLRSDVERFEKGALTRPSLSSPRAQGRVLSLALSPLIFRGAGPPQEIEITPRTEWIRLEMHPAESGSSLFDAILSTIEGKRVWVRQSIRSEFDTVILEIPARKIPAGDYILTLTPSSRDVRGEADRYFLRVIRK